MLRRCIAPVAQSGLLMLAQAAEQVEAAQADLVSIASAFGQAPDVEAAQEVNKENQAPATRAQVCKFTPRNVHPRVCSKPFTLSWN